MFFALHYTIALYILNAFDDVSIVTRTTLMFH